MAKIYYFKLADHAKMFYCTSSRLKLVPGVPMGTELLTKRVRLAKQTGHIVEITESEYNRLLELTNSKPENSESESDEDEETDNDPEREALLVRLKALGLKAKDFKRVAKKSNEDLEAYLEENESE